MTQTATLVLGHEKPELHPAPGRFLERLARWQLRLIRDLAAHPPDRVLLHAPDLVLHQDVRQLQFVRGDETGEQLLARLLKEQSAYQCHRCGFTTRTLHWQCPGCRSWGT